LNTVVVSQPSDRLSESPGAGYSGADGDRAIRSWTEPTSKWGVITFGHPSGNRDVAVTTAVTAF
jgi:hypothetical protein